MKYIKLFENERKLKTYLIEDWRENSTKENEEYLIWKVIGKNTNNEYDAIEVEYSKNFKIKKEKGEPFTISYKSLIEGIIYQTDTIEDALEHIKMLKDTKKYNI